jgi:hypothetical protein
MIPRHKKNPPDEVAFRQKWPKQNGYGNSFEDQLARLINDETGINPLHDLKKYQGRFYVQSRQVFMALMKKHSKKTMNAIGNYMRKDHSTVLYALKAVSDAYETDKIFREMFDRIELKTQNIK